MRQSQIVNIEGLGEVTVKEVSPHAIYKAWGATNRVEQLVTLISGCVDVPKGRLEDLYASELEEILASFMEVNKAFFGIAGQLGLAEPLRAMLGEFSKILPELFASSLKEGITMHGTTAGIAS